MTEKWTSDQIPSQAGRTVLITGANSGIGLEMSVALAAAGARVVMACRSPARAADALAELRRRAPGGDAVLMTLDLASLASVRAFAAEFGRQYATLDLLINNAGILGGPLSKTVDGFESQMGTNHLGHFALTGLLIDRIMATPGSRIITLGSLGHLRAKALALDDLGYAHTPYSEFGGYGNSKLANLLFALELARRLEARGAQTVAAAAHPGFAATNIKKPKHALHALYLRTVTPLALKYVIGTGAMGALPPLYAATMPGVRNDDYWGPDGFKELRGHPARAQRSALARDAEAARRLWEVSEKLTGVSYLG
ncbi:SDR family NAD(P)-dependent oxidoreductase [Solimonas sp. K1W22B-7]|uniref:oxidoreductase n=1 Tax=Solimonas sp. K1W22B-7 TaxID=2303331 RepID=UPI000E33109B|nr:oxidoreductase [Solimonas sp. K1W22B-7]AXQ27840.1 SDR family NAD(P)-dependent oxidoreductase [Solimonas sp. K1W22B-7]